MIIALRNSFLDRVIFGIIRQVFCNNIHFQTVWNKAKTESRIEVFLFRKAALLDKFLMAEKLNWGDNFEEKAILMGEALEYPDFAIKDFVNLRKERNIDNDGKPKLGDRLGFKAFDWGYDAFVFRPENLNNLKKWCNEQKIPLEKVIISDNEIGKWRKQTLAEYENRTKTSS